MVGHAGAVLLHCVAARTGLVERLRGVLVAGPRRLDWANVLSLVVGIALGAGLRLPLHAHPGRSLPRARHHDDRPVARSSCRHARSGNGYSRDEFVIDYDTHTGTCPQGLTFAHREPAGPQRHREDPHLLPPARRLDLRRPACDTSGKARQRRITVCPREIHELQQVTRAAQGSKAWRRFYQRRAGIEGAVNQAANSIGLRKARYRGPKKVELERYLGATAINIIRLDAYFAHQPLPIPAG